MRRAHREALHRTPISLRSIAAGELGRSASEERKQRHEASQVLLNVTCSDEPIELLESCFSCWIVPT